MASNVFWELNSIDISEFFAKFCFFSVFTGCYVDSPLPFQQEKLSLKWLSSGSFLVFTVEFIFGFAWNWTMLEAEKNAWMKKIFGIIEVFLKWKTFIIFRCSGARSDCPPYDHRVTVASGSVWRIKELECGKRIFQHFWFYESPILPFFASAKSLHSLATLRSFRLDTSHWICIKPQQLKKF